MSTGSNSSQSMSVGNPKDSGGDLNIQELSIATQLLWSSVDKIRDILGKSAVMTKSGDIDGTPCFLIALPRARWQFAGKQPIPIELIQGEEETVSSVGNPPGEALAIGPSVGNSEKTGPGEAPQALAIEKEEKE